MKRYTVYALKITFVLAIVFSLFFNIWIFGVSAYNKHIQKVYTKAVSDIVTSIISQIDQTKEIQVISGNRKLVLIEKPSLIGKPDLIEKPEDANETLRFSQTE